MASKRIDPIDVPIRLDTKDAVTQEKKKKNELKKTIGSDGSSKGISLDIQSKKAIGELDKILDKIDDINAHPIQIDVETPEFSKVASELEKAENDLSTNAIKEEQAKLANLKPIETKVGNVTKVDFSNIKEAEQRIKGMTELLEEAKLANSQVEQNPIWQQYEKLGDAVANAQSQMKQLSESGKQFQLVGDPEKLKAANEELSKATDKIRLLAVKKKELADKDISTGGGGSATSSAAIAVLSKGAGKTFGVVSAIGKVLKKSLLTLAAVTLGVRGLMGIINKIRGMIKEGFAAIYEGDKNFKKQVDDLKKSWAEVKANLAAAFMPIVQMAIPYIQQLLNWINQLISKLAMFVAAIAGQNAYTKAIKATGDAAKGAAKQLSKFDELNNLSSGGGGSDWSTEKVPIDAKVLDTVEKLKAILAEIKKIFDELVATPFMEGFNAAIGDWRGKLDTIKTNIMSIGSSLWEIFTDPKVVATQTEYIKSFSRFLGSLVGLAANIGLNIGEAITGGIAKFLNDHKEEIKTDLTNLFTLGADTFDNFSQLAVDLSKIIDTIGESESLQGSISNLLGVVYELYSALGLVAAQLADLVSGTVADLVHEHVEQIKESLEGLFEVLEKITGFLEQVATTIKGLLLRLVGEVITPIIEALKPLISNVIDVVLELWSKVQPVLLWLMDHISELWADYVDPVLNQVMDLAAAVAELVGEVVGRIWDVYLKPLVDLIMAWMPTILSVVKVTFDGIFFLIKVAMTLIGSLLATITDVVKMVTKLIQGDWKGAFEMATQIVQDLFYEPVNKIWGAFMEYFEECYNHYLELFQNLMHGVVKTAETIANAIFSLINDSLIKIANAAIEAFNAIPGVNLSSIPNIPNIQWSASVPALAQGTVIPPSMSDFIARLGDNNTETEVVSPLSTIKDALVEALQETGGAGGGEYHIHVDVDGREIAKAVVRQNEMYRKSTGKSLLAY